MYSHCPTLLIYFLILLFPFTTSSSSTPFTTRIPPLRPLMRTITRHDPKTLSLTPSMDSENRFETYFYPQTLDHFNFKPDSYETFKQRYLVNSKYWGGPKSSAPILVYFGAEESIEDDLHDIGFLTDNASRFKALLVYLEHRYYGKSIPFKSSQEALKNASTLGYFNSAQAIADYAAILLHIKREFRAEDSPIIVGGGSYGGLLAAWFRLKYPHIAIGALASSAPMLSFDDINPRINYYYIVTKDFKEHSESCYEIIRKSWGEIDKIASVPNGLSILSKKFRTCKKLKRSSELKEYLDSLYTEVAQYNHPPTYPLSIVCGGIDGAHERRDILGKIFEGIIAYFGNRSCYKMDEYNYPSEENRAWKWQTCTELVIPIGHGHNDTMFPTAPFDLNTFTKTCESDFGVKPQLHWLSTYYGCHDLKLTLHRFASNIIFSNGLRDPYSSGGILENISDSVVAVSTVNGSHCLDILLAKESDPEWLVKQRKTEVQIMEGWIAKYYEDLQMFKSAN